MNQLRVRQSACHVFQTTISDKAVETLVFRSNLPSLKLFCYTPFTQCRWKMGLKVLKEKVILSLQAFQVSGMPLSLVIVLTQMEVQKCGFVTTIQYIVLRRGYAYYKYKLLVQLFIRFSMKSFGVRNFNKA